MWCSVTNHWNKRMLPSVALVNLSTSSGVIWSFFSRSSSVTGLSLFTPPAPPAAPPPLPPPPPLDFICRDDWLTLVPPLFVLFELEFIASSLKGTNGAKSFPEKIQKSKQTMNYSVSYSSLTTTAAICNQILYVNMADDGGAQQRPHFV